MSWGSLDIWKRLITFLLRKTANRWFFYCIPRIAPACPDPDSNRDYRETKSGRHSDMFFPIPLKNGDLFFIPKNRIKNSEPL